MHRQRHGLAPKGGQAAILARRRASPEGVMPANGGLIDNATYESGQGPCRVFRGPATGASVLAPSVQRFTGLHRPGRAGLRARQSARRPGRDGLGPADPRLSPHLVCHPARGDGRAQRSAALLRGGGRPRRPAASRSRPGALRLARRPVPRLARARAAPARRGTAHPAARRPGHAAGHHRRLLLGAGRIAAGLRLHVPGPARVRRRQEPGFRRGAVLQPGARADPAGRLPPGAELPGGRPGALCAPEQCAPVQRADHQPRHLPDQPGPPSRGLARRAPAARLAGRQGRARRR